TRRTVVEYSPSSSRAITERRTQQHKRSQASKHVTRAFRTHHSLMPQGATDLGPHRKLPETPFPDVPPSVKSIRVTQSRGSTRSPVYAPTAGSQRWSMSCIPDAPAQPRPPGE